MEPQEKPKYPPGYYLRHFWTFVKPYRRPLRTVYLLFLVNGMLNLLPAMSVRFYIDLVLMENDTSFLGMRFQAPTSIPVAEKIQLSLFFFAFILVLIVAANSIGVVMWRKATRSTEQVLFDIKISIHDHINKLSLRFFNAERVGTIMTKAVTDATHLGMFLRQSFVISYFIVQIICAPFFMIALSWPLFLIALLPIPQMLYAFYSLRRRLKPMYHMQRQTEQVINSQMQEIVTGIREIKAFNMEERSGKQYRDINQQFYNVQNRIMRTWSFNHQLQYASRDVATVSIAVGGGFLILSGIGGVTVGIITSFLVMSRFLYDPINWFFGMFDTMQRGMVSLERIVDFLAVEPDILDEKDARELSGGSVKGTVCYDAVSFSYDKRTPVLSDVSFSVPAGQKIAVVGPSGSGKSTLLSLLLRFYDVDRGCIMLDGTDIRSFTQRSLRSSIGIVFQETFLFYGSIRDNLLFANPDRSETDLTEACKAANVYELIQELPDGFDTLVGERGVKLSGGQKQRISIARVILKDPSVVILDEATSAVDTVTEQLIQQSIERLLSNRTAFIIAHRLSTIRQCDQILVLDKGRVAEIGTHRSLLEQKGMYYRMTEANAIDEAVR